MCRQNDACAPHDSNRRDRRLEPIQGKTTNFTDFQDSQFCKGLTPGSLPCTNGSRIGDDSACSINAWRDFQLLSDLRMLAGEVAELLDEIKRNFPPGASPAHQHFDVFRPVFFSGFRIGLQRVALAVPRFARALRVVAEKMPGFMGRRVRPALRADEGNVQRSSKRAIEGVAIGPKLIDAENG